MQKYVIMSVENFEELNRVEELSCEQKLKELYHRLDILERKNILGLPKAEGRIQVLIDRINGEIKLLLRENSTLQSDYFGGLSPRQANGYYNKLDLCNLKKQKEPEGIEIYQEENYTTNQETENDISQDNLNEVTHSIFEILIELIQSEDFETVIRKLQDLVKTWLTAEIKAKLRTDPLALGVDALLLIKGTYSPLSFTLLQQLKVHGGRTLKNYLITKELEEVEIEAIMKLWDTVLTLINLVPF
jgi:hypothetical protein